MNRTERNIELNRVKKEIALLIPHLGKHKIEELRQVIDRHYAKRFKGKRRTPKYGSLDKCFTDEQLHTFLNAVDESKFKLLFSYQAYMGLRIGEAVKVNLKDIDMKARVLKIYTEKAQKADELRIPPELYSDTVSYINNHKAEIESSKEYLFFKNKAYYSGRKEAWLEENYVRKRFSHYIVKAKLENQEYGTSDEEKGRTPRKLHRFTTHSLRHYAITKFSKACNGNLILTSRFARHSEPNITMTYIENNKEQLYKGIDNAFGQKPLICAQPSLIFSQPY